MSTTMLVAQAAGGVTDGGLIKPAAFVAAGLMFAGGSPPTGVMIADRFRAATT